MSQIQSFESSVVPPVGGPILTLTGDQGAAIAPTLGNVNIQATPSIDGPNPDRLYGFALLTSVVTDENPVMPASTLKIEPYNDKVTTADAVATTFVKTGIAIDNSEAWVINATVIGNRDDYSAASGGFVSGVVRRAAAGGAILVGDGSLPSGDAVGGIALFGLILVGNTVFVYVQGIAGQTWNWTCTFSFQKQLL